MPLASKIFPQPLPLRRLLGPSFIILALGFGSGEVILWPYLVSNVGLGIAWAALLGITFQYFINMEIERYALVRGESVFVGFARFWKLAPYWFIASTFIGFGLPGIIAAAAQVFASLLGISQFKWIAMGLLIGLGVLLSASRTVYGSLERITTTIIFLGLPFICVLTLALSDASDWLALGQGLLGNGEGYRWFAPGLSLATFLAAFAYSGAGGNLNLTQSIYIKEKGYGMGFYAQKIAGLFTMLKTQQQLRLEGEAAAPTPENIAAFRQWWKKINAEHLLVFWLLGFVGITLLMLLAHATAYGVASSSQGIQFVITEGAAITERLGKILGTIFLAVIGVMLVQTQLGVLDSTSRIMAENAVLAKRASDKPINLSRIYFGFIWAQIAFGVLLFSFNIYEPRSLIVLGAVINAVAMTVHIALTTLLNRRALEKVFQPAIWRQIILSIIFLFFAIFSGITLVDSLQKLA